MRAGTAGEFGGIATVQDFVNWLAVVIGVVAITLAVVAIWFAVSVDRRARQQQSDLTLRSLLRVQAAVEAQAGDTQNLIRAGWERMAGQPPGQPAGTPYPTDQARALAVAIVEELRGDAPSPSDAADLGTEAEPTARAESSPAFAPRMPAQYDRPRGDLTSAGNGSGSATPDPEGGDPMRIDLGPVQHWSEILGRLDPLAHELARALDAYTEPLHRPEYLVLARHRRTAPAVRELRRAGLLAPLPHRGNEDGPPVYGFPPGLAGPVHTAFEAGPREEPKAATLVRDVLVEAGYLSRTGDEYVLAHRDGA